MREQRSGRPRGFYGHRVLRPAVERLDRRELLATMAASPVQLTAASPIEITGIAGGGSVWNYADATGWTSYGGGGLTSVLYGPHNASGVDVIYAQAANGEVFERLSGGWVDTHGALVIGSVVADGNGGISGIAGGGSVWHYSDAGWTNYGGGGFSSVIAAYNGSTQADVFAQAANGAVFRLVGGQWQFTGGYLAVGSMVPASGFGPGVSGITGIAGGGSVWHYQDNAGWTNFGGAGVVALLNNVHTTSTQGEDLFAQTGDGRLFVRGTSGWVDTGGGLVVGSMVPTGGFGGAVSGVTGIAGGGSVWHYQVGKGWTSYGGGGVVALAGSSDASEVFAQVGTGEVYSSTPTPGRWVDTHGTLYLNSTAVPPVSPPSPPTSPVPPVPPTVPPPPPPPATGTLIGAYYGVIQDRPSNLDFGAPALVQNHGPHNIYLSDIHVTKNVDGDDVTGILTIVDWVADKISFPVPFVGKFFADDHPDKLDIEDASPDYGVIFDFNFVVNPDGSLACTRGTDYDFDVDDENNGWFDSGDHDPTSYVLLYPNPNGGL